MKKNQLNEILSNQAKRRNAVLSFVCAIIIVTVLVLSFFLLFLQSNKSYYVNYNEKSNIDYKVYLKDNEFFEKKYLGKNQQYIASLIDYIDATFNYKLSIEEDVEYKYSYRIETDVNVKNKTTNNSLYNKQTTLLTSEEKRTNEKSINIKENINIDYNQYNELIKKFIKVYNLNDIESTLTVNLYVNIVGSCEKIEKNEEKESVISIAIPLTTQTTAIELSDDLINTDNNVMQCKKSNVRNVVFITLVVLFAIVDVILIVLVIKYEIKTRTAENIYEKELKKILNNYSSYIQILNNDFNFNEYQLIKLNTFNDMLEIRDTIRQPILMKENANKTGAYFVIPSNTKILYVYRLKVSDIESKIKQKTEIDDMDEF